jgi:uncharacterized protein YebE (UPF0316 family)
VPDGPLFAWVVLPLLIFVGRVLDVSLGTVRIVFLARGLRLAALIGFFEVLIWLLAIGQIMQNLDNPACFLAYAGGFASGNLAGLWLEGKLAVGTQIVRVLLRAPSPALVEALRAKDFGVTIVPAEGRTGPVQLLFSVVRRQDVPEVLALVTEHAPRAFYTIEDVRSVAEGIFPGRSVEHRQGFLRK